MMWPIFIAGCACGLVSMLSTVPDAPSDQTPDAQWHAQMDRRIAARRSSNRLLYAGAALCGLALLMLLSDQGRL